MRTIQHSRGAAVVGGRKRPAPPKPGDPKRLKLSDYLSKDVAKLPSPPSSCDYTSKASAALAQVYLNDRLGCCVIAGFYHVLGCATGAVRGSPFVATDAEILADYEAIGGYNPADPKTDQGCDEYSALQYWHEHDAADGSTVDSFIQLDASSLLELRLGCWLFGAVYWGIELPDGWISPSFPSPGFVWDVAGDPDPNNGHCYVSPGYDSSGFLVSTWGMMGRKTNAAAQKYASPDAGGQAYAFVSTDWVDATSKLAPNGIDWDCLRQDLDELAQPAPPLPPQTPVPPTQPGT